MPTVKHPLDHTAPERSRMPFGHRCLLEELSAAHGDTGALDLSNARVHLSNTPASLQRGDWDVILQRAVDIEHGAKVPEKLQN